VITQYYAVINNEVNLRIQYDALKRAEKTVEDTKKYIAVGQKREWICRIWAASNAIAFIHRATDK